jgi:hypothetical protein
VVLVLYGSLVQRETDTHFVLSVPRGTATSRYSGNKKDVLSFELIPKELIV